MEREFRVVIKGTDEQLEDITAFEVCEAVRKQYNYLEISVSEKRKEG